MAPDERRGGVVTLTETAKRISAHLKRFEADPDSNRPKRQGAYLGINPYRNANAVRLGRFVGVRYISYQGRHNITRQEAERYLSWLDAGHVGTHWQALREATA